MPQQWERCWLWRKWNREDPKTYVLKAFVLIQNTFYILTLGSKEISKEVERNFCFRCDGITNTEYRIVSGEYMAYNTLTTSADTIYSVSIDVIDILRRIIHTSWKLCSPWSKSMLRRTRHVPKPLVPSLVMINLNTVSVEKSFGTMNSGFGWESNYFELRKVGWNLNSVFFNQVFASCINF